MFRRNRIMSGFSSIKLVCVLCMGIFVGPTIAADSVLADVTGPGGKPGAPVTIEVKGNKRVDSGEYLDVVVEISTRGKVDSLQVNLKSTPGLEIVDRKLYEFTNRDLTEVIQLPVRLVALADGLHRLRIFVRTSTNGKERARVSSVALVVGASTVGPRKPVNLVHTAEGEVLREVPMDEEVSTGK